MIHLGMANILGLAKYSVQLGDTKELGRAKWNVLLGEAKYNDHIIILLYDHVIISSY